MTGSFVLAMDGSSDLAGLATLGVVIAAAVSPEVLDSRGDVIRPLIAFV